MKQHYWLSSKTFELLNGNLHFRQGEREVITKCTADVRACTYSSEARIDFYTMQSLAELQLSGNNDHYSKLYVHVFQALIQWQKHMGGPV